MNSANKIVSFPSGLVTDADEVREAAKTLGISDLIGSVASSNRPIHIEVHIHNNHYGVPAEPVVEKPKDEKKSLEKKKEKRTKMRMKYTMFWGKLTMYGSKLFGVFI
jgi:hypothetical protein